MTLVIGLGNPGKRYDQTRHNIGFKVVDRLAERHGARLEKKQLGSLVDRIRVGTEDAVLAKPQSWMNLSGQPTASLKGYYKVDVGDIVVIHDEVDLPFGEVRIKNGGGHNGHNGLRDVQAKLGNNGFIRVRFGVSRPPQGWDTADYVLGKWSAAESDALDGLIDSAADAVETILSSGPKAAIDTFNQS